MAGVVVVVVEEAEAQGVVLVDGKERFGPLGGVWIGGWALGVVELDCGGEECVGGVRW